MKYLFAFILTLSPFIAYCQPTGVINFIEFELSDNSQEVLIRENTAITKSSFTTKREVRSEPVNNFISTDSSFISTNNLYYIYSFYEGYRIPTLKIYHENDSMIIHFAYKFCVANTIIEDLKFEKGEFFFTIPCEAKYEGVNGNFWYFIKNPEFDRIYKF